ncbi:MAG: 3-phosphoserine/phosphohydroxythreonine transaminase [Pseudomonadota bacterium]
MSSEHYFGAGPAAIPLAVKQQFQNAVIQYEDLPISILELSHRSEAFTEILEDARKALRSLYTIPDNYHILFMQGGATLQFDAVPLNLLGQSHQATYVDTGLWSHRAANFAEKYTQVNLISGLENVNGKSCCVSSSQWEYPKDSAYLYVVPNETVDGIALPEVEVIDMPIVADMTSCFLMRTLDVSRYGVIFSATQKTLGISGLTIVIIREDLLDKASAETPYLLRYDEHVKENSIVNTSPVVACYITKLMLKWVCDHGGLDQMIQEASSRAKMLYSTIDESDFWFNSVCNDSRSTMNVVFDCQDKNILSEFFERAEQQGLTGLKGHRQRGGVRASMYNGTPMEAVSQLTELMRNYS